MDALLDSRRRLKTGVFDDFWKTDKTSGDMDSYNYLWNLHKEIGEGAFNRIELRPGFSMCIADYRLQNPIAMAGECPDEIGFTFILSGLIKCKIDDLKDEYISRGGQNELIYHPYQSGNWEEAEKNQISGVSLFIEPDHFQTLMQEDFIGAPDDFVKIGQNKEGKPLYFADSISPYMLATLSQVLNCPFLGATRRLYLEGKALELLAQKINQLETGKKNKPRKTSLQANDIERIYHARDLLIHDLEHPPRISDLARSVGLTHNRMILGFREVFQTTPFIYLRNMRLCKAKLLLDEGMVNVSEAAFTVGYSSLSHFATAFSQYFGIPPGDYLRESVRSRLSAAVNNQKPNHSQSLKT